jgi:tetrapyrrole methylase family protein/MazG family protein
VFRHPNIFDDTPAESHKEALDRWEEMKKKEKKTGSLSADLDRVARTLPSLLRSQKLLKKAQKAGYYEFPEECLDRDAIMEEYFHLCALANKAGVNLEQEAYAENERFIERMTVLEKLMEDQYADR